MFSNINYDLEISIRETGNFMDWFISYENKIENIHKTNVALIILGVELFSCKIPINFSILKFNFSFNIEKDFVLIDNFAFVIPEMNIRRVINFEVMNLKLHDTINMEYELKWGG